VSVHVIARHGLRTPLSATANDHVSWDCDDLSVLGTVFGHEEMRRVLDTHSSTVPVNHLHSKQYMPAVGGLRGSCYMGQLTSLGNAQMHAFGAALRQHYIHRLHFLSDVFRASAGELFVRSTDSKRTIESAHCVLSGLYPVGKREDGADGLVQINTVERGLEYMYGRGGCDRLMQLRGDFKALPDTLERRKKMERISRDATANGLSGELRSFPGLYNTCETLMLHGHPLPPGVTNEHLPVIQAEAGKDHAASSFSVESCRLCIGRFIGELAANLKAHSLTTREDAPTRSLFNFLRWPPGPPAATVAHATPAAAAGGAHPHSSRMCFYSAHDTTLVALLSSFGVYNNTPPPMGSHIVLELYALAADPPAATAVMQEDVEVWRDGGIMKGPSAPPPPGSTKTRAALKHAGIHDRHYVRLLFNGQTLQMPGVDGVTVRAHPAAAGGAGGLAEPQRVFLVPLSEFLSYAKDYVPTDYTKECAKRVKS